MLLKLLPLIILALIYFIHKIIHKTKFVKLETINLKPHDYDNQNKYSHTADALDYL